MKEPKTLAILKIDGDNVIFQQYGNDDYALCWENGDYSVRGTLQDLEEESGLANLLNEIKAEERGDKS